MVSIHAPARGATFPHVPNLGDMSSFNSRAREGRDWLPVIKSSQLSRFNSRAREGRDRSDPRHILAQSGVSIHAPARGATGAEGGEE